MKLKQYYIDINSGSKLLKERTKIENIMMEESYC